MTDPGPDMEISVVVPMHNEAGNCRSLVREIADSRAEYGGRCEIICVDDASGDQTAEILAALREEVEDLRVLRLQENCGQSTALCVGIARARGRIIVTMDGDGQNNPADVPDMLRLLRQGREQGIEMVAGWRKKRRDTLWRRLTSRIANRVRALLLKDRTPDTGCGLKVFYRSTFMALPWFDHMHRFLPALVQRGGGGVVSIPVDHRPRRHGRSHYGTLDRLRVGITDLFGVAWLQRRSRLPKVSEMGEQEP